MTTLNNVKERNSNETTHVILFLSSPQLHLSYKNLPCKPSSFPPIPRFSAQREAAVNLLLDDIFNPAILN